MRPVTSALALAGAVALLWACGVQAGTGPGPLPDGLRRGTRIVEEPWKRPPDEWYEAMDVPPVKKLLGEEGCYAVVRVERGFDPGHISGRYLVVTLSFREPELVVVSKSLMLPHGESGGRIHALWSGRLTAGRVERAAEEIREARKTGSRTFMPDEGPPRGLLSEKLNRLGIGSLPSVAGRVLHPFPRISFQKHVDKDGEVSWWRCYSGGGRTGGGSTGWRVTMAALWDDSALKRREAFHEFTVARPFSINDTRYEKLLMELAAFSDVLKAEIARKHQQLAQWRAERQAKARAVEAKATVGAVAREAPPVVGPGRVPEGGSAGGFAEEEGSRWSALLAAPLSAMAGMVLGAVLALLLTRRRRRGAATA